MKSPAGQAVNKALIYYYFESKDQIVEELMLGMIKELVRKGRCEKCHQYKMVRY
ncbi:MAG TPA: TetR family transcriptional regulator [Selenomonadales bacterium]|nr:TetR family transcriptional regulator [Selenomonadales bacterium]